MHNSEYQIKSFLIKKALYQQFKAYTRQHGKVTYRAIEEAIREYLERHDKPVLLRIEGSQEGINESGTPPTAWRACGGIPTDGGKY